MGDTLHPMFTWGVGTSAYQIEGGIEDGKGESIWDRFARDSPMVDDGVIACDHYHRYRSDVALMADLGVDAYRFSIAWTRILPEGRGRVEPRGLDFYNRLIDELLGAGVTPWVTLYHWDLPQAIQDRGGWVNREVVDAFAEYTGVVADALGDRVTNWITHNEPWVASMLGYQQGVLAPGVTGWDNGLGAAHHLLLSHGRAVAEIRSRVADARVGLALDCRPVSAASDRPEDLEASVHFDGFRNRWFFDPVFGRGYPTDMAEVYERLGRWNPDWVRPGDIETIGTPIDFLGVNYYTAFQVSAGREEVDDSGIAPGHPALPGHTEMGWPIVPSALADFLVRVQEEYDPPSIIITENGASYSDAPDRHGVVADERRIAYLASHVAAVDEARSRGARVDGYFLWSLLDNLEWVAGFSQRFGLVWVDRQTLERIPKASFFWYRDVIASRR